MGIRLKRVYEASEPGDGTRVLVDRLWPRGVRKEAAAIDLWLKDVAPSPELRRWFGHDPERFAEFTERYRAELVDSTALDELRAMMGKGPVTLVYAAHDQKINHAVVLREVLDEG